MSMFQTVGAGTRGSIDTAGYTVNLLIRTVLAFGYLPRRARFTLDVAYAAGVRALPVTIIVAFFAGMILSLQSGIELRRLGQSELIGTLTAISMCREMGPFMTAIILAAMVGSSIAAELGTMRVSEEITALDVMSIDSTNYLVLPRVVGLTVMCPMLTVFSNLIGIGGGSFVADNHLGVTQDYYWLTVREALLASGDLLPKDVYVGLLKAVIFGCTIATISCSAGLRASGGALGVGRAVQQAVMQSIIMIIILDMIVAWFFYFL